MGNTQNRSSLNNISLRLSCRMVQLVSVSGAVLLIFKYFYGFLTRVTSKMEFLHKNYFVVES